MSRLEERWESQIPQKPKHCGRLSHEAKSFRGGIWSVMKNVVAARSEVELGRELFRLLPRGGLISKSFARRELDSV